MATQRRRALLVGFYAYPDPAVGARRLSELANHLARAGWQTKIVAADDPSATGGGQLDSAVDRIGVPVPPSLYSRYQRFVPRQWRGAQISPDGVTDDSKNSGGRQAAGQTRFRFIEQLRTEYLRYSDVVDARKRWSWRLTLKLLGLTQNWRPHVMVASGPEWSPLIAATAVAAVRRLPLVLDFRDPWLGRGGYTSPIYDGARRKADARLESWAVRHADAITVSSARLLADLQARYVDRSAAMHLVRNGFDPASWLPPAAPTGRLDLLHAGTIYFNRSPIPLLTGLRLFVSRPGIDREAVSLTLVGDCARWQGIDLADWVRGYGLDPVVKIRPPVSAAEVRELTEHASVLVTFAQGQPSQVPAKLYEQIGANREILLYAEPASESAEVVAGLPAVTVLDDQPQQSEAFLLGAYERHVLMKGSQAVDPVRSSGFSRRAGLETFAKLLEKVAVSHR